MPDAPRPGPSPAQHRRLGRGLSGLLSIPVDVPAAPQPEPTAPAEPGASPGAPTSTAQTRSSGEGPVPPTSLNSIDVLGRSAPTPLATDAAQPDASTASAESRPPSAESITHIPVTSIRPNTRQPRRDFPEAAIASLAASISQVGILQPVIVRRIRDIQADSTQIASNDGLSAHFELVAGERRWRAAQLAGLSSIPAIVRSMDDQASGLAALIENVQREDLNPIERSDGLQRLIDEFGLTHQELAAQVALDRSSVSNLLRLRDLDPFTRDAVRTGRLSQGHAKALLAIADSTARRHVAAAAIAGDWSVRELERRVRLLSAERETNPVAAIPAPSAPSAHVADLERRLSEHLGSRVRIQLGRKKGTGRVVLEFFNLDQFDGLLAKLGFDSPE